MAAGSSSPVPALTSASPLSSSSVARSRPARMGQVEFTLTPVVTPGSVRHATGTVTTSGAVLGGSVFGAGASSAGAGVGLADVGASLAGAGLVGVNVPTHSDHVGRNPMLHRGPSGTRDGEPSNGRRSVQFRTGSRQQPSLRRGPALGGNLPSGPSLRVGGSLAAMSGDRGSSRTVRGASADGPRSLQTSAALQLRRSVTSTPARSSSSAPSAAAAAALAAASRRPPAHSRAEQHRSTLLDAVALQDHFVRSMKLGLPDGRSSSFRVPRSGGGQGAGPTHRTVRKVASAPKERMPLSFTTNDYLSSSHCGPRRRRVSDRWKCRSCENVNVEALSFCEHCGSLRDDDLPEDDTPKKPALTLAQKRGLVPAPPPSLSKDEWKATEAVAAKRLAAGDSDSCAICMEEFGMEHQVILSCSHMFHKACLESFESFVRVRERTCPMCRKANYEKRYTRQGRIAHIKRCVITIQAWYRGVKTRLKFYGMKKKFYENGGGDDARRRLFYAEWLGKVSDGIARAVAKEGDAIDALFAEIDRDVETSRQVFNLQHPRLRAAADPWHRSDGDDSAAAAAAETATEESLYEAYVPDSILASADESRVPAAPHPVSVNWEMLLAQARGRGSSDCPICICTLSSSNRKELSILSCSHVFHSACIAAFERFSISGSPCCPVCRSAYCRVPAPRSDVLPEAEKADPGAEPSTELACVPAAGAGGESLVA